MDLFPSSWTALRTAVADTPDEDFDRPSGCAGWLVRDLVCHLVIGAQDVLITLVTPADGAPTADAAGYWIDDEPDGGEGPPDALVPRLAAAYGEPRWLKFHFDDLGAAAGRAAELADPAARVSTAGKTLTVADYLSAYVLEWTLHHLDLVAHRPAAGEPPAASLAGARTLLERIAGGPLPAELSDKNALLIGTGRRAPTERERALLTGCDAKLPVALG
ncbi:maleylpyruvate isomerase N-terminal domain-containing protein [Streptomyces sp. NPDC050085]|uniref:maleylpyruvate isomerase N-terminal domain-containing protein n=1 Tax=Streptomyces sp. NPDC050085 TaxID=3365600 RepID=UPI0037B96C7C